MFKSLKNALIVAPHPDDETLGVGGTIARLVEIGVKVHILFVGGHLPPVYTSDKYLITCKEAKEALKALKVNDYKFLDIPATTFNMVPKHEFNLKIKNYIDHISPELVFLPFPDRHIDHKIVFDSTLVACRPIKTTSPRYLLCYETLSETHWNVSGIEPNFTPDFFVDITFFIEDKISALRCYKSQISKNGPRGLDANKALAKFRGSQNNFTYAEAFKVVRFSL